METDHTPLSDNHERMKVELRVLVFHDEGMWVAQCIEHDITARSKSLTAVPKNFARSLAANIAINEELGRHGLDGVPPAPPSFVDLFDQSPMELKPRAQSSPGLLTTVDFRYAEAAFS